MNPEKLEKIARQKCAIKSSAGVPVRNRQGEHYFKLGFALAETNLVGQVERLTAEIDRLRAEHELKGKK